MTGRAKRGPSGRSFAIGATGLNDGTLYSFTSDPDAEKEMWLKDRTLATPLGASAKFASSGQTVGKKDLSLIASMYGHVYVARVAFGAKMAQTAQAFLEAEAYPGPSLIVAYSHCIAHGYDMAQGVAQQKLAVDSGVWPLYRFDPRRPAKGEPPLHLDYAAPKAKVADYMRNEGRFRMVERAVTREPRL